MAINLDVQDLENYPGNIKRVTLDVDTVVPTGTEGDEKMMMVGSTTAYSDIDKRTTIQSIYVLKGYVGWAKSSGLKGAAGKFALDANHCRLGISMDNTVSGTFTYQGKSYYEIELDYNSNSTPKSGEDIAEDMKKKIRAITCSEGDTGVQLAYKNCSVKFDNGKFYISSGTISNSYIGDIRSSVSVAPAPTNDCSAILGFDHPVTSEEMAGLSVSEANIISDYTADTPTLMIEDNTGAQSGDAMYITDGVNYDYFTAITVSGTTVTVPTMANNGFTGIKHNYTVTGGSYVQVLRKQDPDVQPNRYFDDVDGLMRYMTKCLINQIDFSG